MKILLISQSDLVGGAARAAFRLNLALKKSSVESRMMVRVKKSDDKDVYSSNNNFWIFFDLLRFHLGQIIQKLQKSSNVNFHSGNYLPSNWSKDINSSDIDIVNLHWVAGETISIEDIGRINKPIVWTLHDMWAFCGSEHVVEDNETARWRTGYTKKSRRPSDFGLDLDKWVWKRKLKLRHKNIHYVSPSSWLAACVKDSELLSFSNISVIPNAVDLSIYKPLDKKTCREILNIPQNKVIVLFGAMGGTKDKNKGYDLLKESLVKLSVHSDISNVHFVIHGQSEPSISDIDFLETTWLGHVNDDTTLAVIYNAADIMVVPSRIENLPQSATEAQSCGVPVIGFNCTGLPDAVENNRTGILVSAYDTLEMSNALERLISDEPLRKKYAHNSRQRAERLWSEEVIATKYKNLFSKILS